MEPELPNLPARKPARRRAAPQAAPVAERQTAIASISAWLARLPGAAEASSGRREAWEARREARDLMARAADRAEASADLLRRAMNRVEAGPAPDDEARALTALPPGAPNVHAFSGLQLPVGADPVADYPALVLEPKLPAAVMTPMRAPGSLPAPAVRARRAGDAPPLGRDLAGEPVAAAARRLAAAPASEPEADVPSARRRAPGLPDLVAVSAKIVEAARSASAKLPAPQDLVAALVGEAEASLRRAGVGAPAVSQPSDQTPAPALPEPARSLRRRSPFAGRELEITIPMIPAAPAADDLPDLASLVASADAASEVAVPAWVRGDERRLLLEIPGPGEAQDGAELFRLFRQNATGLQDLADESNRKAWWQIAAR